MPHASITTDIIVGFPGESEEDFQATLDVVAEARFTSAYTFQYSPRPGTPAADMADQVPKQVVSQRYMRLTDLQDRICLEENQKLIGAPVEVLVTADGRKDQSRMTGRAGDGRLVHFVAEGDAIRPGDLVTTIVTGAAPHYLLADDGIRGHRRTRAGDAHAAGTTPQTPPVGVGLGLPPIGKPVEAPVESACGAGCEL
jgi:tRNA-2-methylthio-N6-dimethylallyladenosine synthase